MRILLRSRLLSILLLATLATALVVGYIIQHEGRQTRSWPETGIRIDLGYSRRSGRGTELLDVCGIKDPSTPPECPQPGKATTADKARPPIASVQFSQVPQSTSHPLPAAAFALSAENVGRTGVAVSVTFDPADLDEIPGGVYQGRVLILRDADPPISASLMMVVDSRTHTFPLAISCLVVGGLFGLTVRWFTDIGAPVAALYRRLRRLRRLLPSSERALLSEDVEVEFREAGESLDALDPAGFTARVGRLEGDLAQLQAASRQLRGVARAADRADRLANQDNVSPDLGVAAARISFALRSFLRREHELAWPWADATKLQTRLQQTAKLAAFTERLESLIDGASTGDDKPVRSLRIIAAAISVKGPDVLLEPDPVEEVVLDSEATLTMLAGDIGPPLPGTGGEIAVTDDLPRSEDWARQLLRVVGSVTSMALLVVLTVIGFMTRVDTNSYSGRLKDALGLWVWAFGVAVTGGTVIGLLGQLSGMKTGTQSSGATQA